MRFNEILKTKMKEKGLGAAELSYRCEGQISEGYIRKLLASEDISPTIKTVQTLAKGLGVRTSELVDTDNLPESYRPIGDVLRELEKRIRELEENKG